MAKKKLSKPLLIDFLFEGQLMKGVVNAEGANYIDVHVKNKVYRLEKDTLKVL